MKTNDPKSGQLIVHLRKIFALKNSLQLIIRGTSLIERILNVAVSEALPNQHVIELSRMSFQLRIDLAIGLGVLPADTRSTYIKLYKIRSRFAHSPVIRFTKRDARDFLNAMTPRIRDVVHTWDKQSEIPKDPLQVLREAIAVLFIGLEQAVKQMRDNRVREQAWHQEVVDTLSKGDAKRREQYGNEHVARVEAKVNEARKQRSQLGEL